eukprot:658626-Pyramimonas_sp.AAC.1
MASSSAPAAAAPCVSRSSAASLAASCASSCARTSAMAAMVPLRSASCASKEPACAACMRHRT